MSQLMDRRVGGRGRRALRYRHEVEDGVTIVHLDGVIDASTIDDLAAAISRCPLGFSIVADMEGVTFCAAVGLRLLLATQTHLRRTRRTLTLRAPSPSVLRLIEITETAAAFTIDHGQGGA
jgi:anti-anti-sigma factor